MNHHDEAIKAIAGYLDKCESSNELHAAICLRALIETTAQMYANCTTAQQAYESLASIALDLFNADQATRKQWDVSSRQRRDAELPGMTKGQA